MLYIGLDCFITEFESENIVIQKKFRRLEEMNIRCFSLMIFLLVD